MHVALLKEFLKIFLTLMRLGHPLTFALYIYIYIMNGFRTFINGLF